jgi:hypothetical protein
MGADHRERHTRIFCGYGGVIFGRKQEARRAKLCQRRVMEPRRCTTHAQWGTVSVRGEHKKLRARD